MNLTNIKYLYDLMDKESFKFFTVYDHKGSPMRDQCNENYSVDDAKNDLKQFLEFNSGVFRVEFRRSKNNTPTTKNYSFTIDNIIQDPQDVSGIGNTGMPMDMMAVIRANDDKIDRLQSEMFANMMAAMTKQHELQLKNLEQSYAKADDGNDALMQTAISALSGMFGGGANIGVSGLDTVTPEIQETQIHTTTENNMVDDKRKKINNAVVRLIEGDLDFAENISKLADLCENNPMIYKMAIQRLDQIK